MIRICFRVATALVLLAAAGPSPASAQMTGGVMGGVNLANIDFSATNVSLNFDQRIGGIGGGFFRYDFRDNLGLQVEGLFSQKGTKTDELDADGLGGPDEYIVLDDLYAVAYMHTMSAFDYLSAAQPDS